MVTTMASVQLVNNHLPHHQRHYHTNLHFPLLRPIPSDPAMTLDFSVTHASENCSPRDVTSPPSASESEGRDVPNETPFKKNKRKLSEPKKRSDGVTKRLSPNKSQAALDSPVFGPVDAAERNDDQDRVITNKTKTKKLTSGHAKKALSRPTPQQHVTECRQKTPSSSSSENDPSREPDGIPSSYFLQEGAPSGSLSYLPGFYYPGTNYPHPALHASFSVLPLHLQQTYLAAAAAAVQVSSNSQSTNPTSAPGISSLSTSGIEINSERSHPSKPNFNQTIIPPSTSTTALVLQPSSIQRASSSKNSTSNHEDDDDASSSRAQSPEDLSISGKLSRKHRKNYKNMTRERRVEANARERTRVHTISAAFDALRHAVPSYSHNQKLSKLAILRIACSYIMSLARLADLDYTSCSEHIGTPLTFAHTSQTLPSTGIPPQTLPSIDISPQTLPSIGISPQTLTSIGISPQTLTSIGIPPQTLPSIGISPQTLIYRYISDSPIYWYISSDSHLLVYLLRLSHLLVYLLRLSYTGISQTLPSIGISPQSLPSTGIPPQTLPSIGISPQTLPSIGISPQTLPSIGISPQNLPSIGISPQTLPSIGISPQTLPSIGISPQNLPSIVASTDHTRIVEVCVNSILATVTRSTNELSRTLSELPCPSFYCLCSIVRTA
ncbi:hypothetical protein Btru_028823 [Bulinus truncatus]|nr:hypothetical protein Btru_028823 [Bulinus truncatus]